MNHMDNLPATNPSSQSPGAPAVPVTGSLNKESAPIPSLAPEIPPVTEIGKETELPTEVTRAGVTVHSDTIVLPKPVQQLGVTPVGPFAPPSVSEPEIKLPLSDEQIAEGLNQSLQSSWRWLSEWCKRRLLEVHMTIKSVHGKIVRSKVD